VSGVEVESVHHTTGNLQGGVGVGWGIEVREGRK